jgi:hypothetical protein
MPDKNQEENSPVRYPPDTAAQAATGGPEAAPAGEPAVDAMIARLDGLDGLPLDQHVAVFEETHAGLRQVLSELDGEAEAVRPPSAGFAAGR